MIEVRRAGAADVDALGDIHAVAWEAAYAAFFDPEFVRRTVESRRSCWRERLGEERSTVLVAVVDGRPSGLCYLRPSEERPGSAEIYSFYTHPDGWGSGVSSALMAETLRRLRADGVSRVHLWTTRDTTRSRRFYTKSGFTETGAQRDYDFGDGNPLPQLEYDRTC